MGRFAGTFFMKFVQPQKLLSIYAIVNMLLSLCVVFLNGMLSIYALVGMFFFASIMFPTIFALGLRDLGNHTKHASSGIIMAIVGGAVGPYVMGSFNSTAQAYLVPFICFGIVLFFGLNGHRSLRTENQK
jgi:FHS family L-fucose permease-like MFS transporter